MRRYASTDRAVGTRSRTRRSASLADAGEPRSVQARSATREGSRAKGTSVRPVPLRLQSGNTTDDDNDGGDADDDDDDEDDGVGVGGRRVAAVESRRNARDAARRRRGGGGGGDEIDGDESGRERMHSTPQARATRGASSRANTIPSKTSSSPQAAEKTSDEKEREKQQATSPPSKRPKQAPTP